MGRHFRSVELPNGDVVQVVTSEDGSTEIRRLLHGFAPVGKVTFTAEGIAALRKLLFEADDHG